MQEMLDGGSRRRRARHVEQACSRRPACYAEPEEIRALGHVLKQHGARYSSHIRDELHNGLRGRGRGHRHRRELRYPRPDRPFEAFRHRQLGWRQGSSVQSRRPGPAGSRSIATSIPMIPPPIRCAFCCRPGSMRAGWMRCWRASPNRTRAPASARSSSKVGFTNFGRLRILGGHPYRQLADRGTGKTIENSPASAARIRSMSPVT